MGKLVVSAILIAIISIFLGFSNLINVFNIIFARKPIKGLFTLKELQKYNGIDNPEIYLAILGNVFDVTRGSKHYGPGATYNIFVGQDASRSFVTGKFSGKDVSDDVKELTNRELISLNGWLRFYEKEYNQVGKLIGRYYDEYGEPTQYHEDVKSLIKIAESEQHNADLEKLEFPPCNVEWTAETGSRVWCTKRSGGIERDWVGVPRKLYEVGSESHRCACITDKHKNLGNIREYEGCDPNYVSCYIKS